MRLNTYWPLALTSLGEHFNAVSMPEYGAEYWLANQVDRRISIEQFEEIAPEHLRREDELLLQETAY